ncbi:MAG: GNAT family N-acetyltransferase [Ideonella sp.]|nr:GNAT family N-acetyltransferase [Ideonella sp.]
MMTVKTGQDIQVREATPDDDEGVNRLFCTVFGVERSPQHFRWKVYDNPDGAMVALVAVADSEVVGYYGFWPTAMRLGGKRVLGGQALDIMLHPKHRGLPLALRLCSECIQLAGQRGMQLLYGLPNALALKLQVGKLNSDHVGDVPLWVRILDARESLAITGPRGWAVRAMAFLALGSAQGFELRQGMPSSEELADFLGRAKLPHGRLRIASTPERMLWRFGPHAQRNYLWVTAWRAEQLQGLVVVGDHTLPRMALLAELLGVTAAAQEAALQHALMGLKRKGVAAVHAMSTSGPRGQVLKACGFRQRRVTQPLVVHKPLPVTLPANPHVFEDWVVFGADHDVY